MPVAAPQYADAMIARLESEIEERSALVQGLAHDAQIANNGDGRDLTGAEMEQINRAQARVVELTGQLTPLRDSARVTLESRARREQMSAEISRMRGARGAAGLGEVEYRSAGVYMADMYLSKMGDHEAADRLDIFHRAAAHQTTADNPGLLPERIVEPVLNGVDVARPLVSAIGPQNLGAGSWAYARVTQHTQVGVQAAEKSELASRKMIVTKTPITAPTYGGYVNISRQDIRRTSPGIVDMVINDLTGQYAIETELACATDLIAGGTVGTTTIPATPTVLAVSQAVWGAVGQGAALLRTANLPANGPILAVSPDRMGLIGPLFPNVNPQNQITQGFNAADASMQGVQGNPLSGLSVVMGIGLPAATILLIFRSAVRCFEDRYGALKVDEPSVWGLEVGYAGDFDTVLLNAGGVIKISVV